MASPARGPAACDHVTWASIPSICCVSANSTADPVLRPPVLTCLTIVLPADGGRSLLRLPSVSEDGVPG